METEEFKSLLNSEKWRFCMQMFFYNVNLADLFRNQELRKRPLDITDVYWKSFNFLYQTFIYQKATVCFSKEKESKLGGLSGAMSCILLLAVLMYILSMMLFSGDWELLIVIIHS